MSPVNQISSTVKDEDYDLVNAIKSGDKEKFRDLVNKYEQRLFNFGFKMCGNPDDAEDLVQETFINVFRYLEGFRHEAKFRNWLYKIATSICLKTKRKSKFAPEQEVSLDEYAEREPADSSSSTPDWAVLPVDKVLNDELSGVIRNAIVTLPKNYRLVVVLRDMEGFTTEETAKILEITPANVKVRLHRARLYLRDQLKDYKGEAE